MNLPFKAVIGAILCNVLFGSAFPMIKLGYEEFGVNGIADTLLFAGIRFALAGVLVFAATSLSRRRLPTVARGNRTNVLLVVLTYIVLQYLCFYIGLAHTAGVSASIITASSAFLSVFIAHFLYRDDRLTVGKIIGSVIGFIGVVIACLYGGRLASASFLGEGMVFGSSVFFVIGSLISRRAARHQDSFTVTSYNLLFGGILLAVIGVIGGGALTLTPFGALVLLYLVIVSSVGTTAWNLLLRRYPVGKLGVYNFVIPVSGAFLSALFLGENVLTPEYAVALLLVCAGIVTVNGRKRDT